MGVVDSNNPVIKNLDNWDGEQTMQSALEYSAPVPLEGVPGQKDMVEWERGVQHQPSDKVPG